MAKKQPLLRTCDLGPFKILEGQGTVEKTTMGEA